MNEKSKKITSIRTQKAIAKALISLLQEREYEKITVTDICKSADLVRKTFYNNFKSKDQVVTQMMTDIFKRMEQSLELEKMSVREILLAVFSFVEKNREFLILFYNRGLLRFAHESIRAYITEEHILSKYSKEQLDAQAYKYIEAQISAVIISVIETWIENEFEDSVEFLAELTEAMMYKTKKQ